MSTYFAGEQHQPRARRATDAVAVVVGLSLLVWTGFNANKISTADEWFLNLLEPLPTWFDEIWKIGYFFGLIMAACLLSLGIGLGGRGTKHHFYKARLLIGMEIPDGALLLHRVIHGAAGMTVADASMVGAGAILTRDTQPHWVHVGIPARPVKEKPAEERAAKAPPTGDPLADQ